MVFSSTLQKATVSPLGRIIYPLLKEINHSSGLNYHWFGLICRRNQVPDDAASKVLSDMKHTAWLGELTSKFFALGCDSHQLYKTLRFLKD